MSLCRLPIDLEIGCVAGAPSHASGVHPIGSLLQPGVPTNGCWSPTGRGRRRPGLRPVLDAVNAVASARSGSAECLRGARTSSAPGRWEAAPPATGGARRTPKAGVRRRTSSRIVERMRWAGTRNREDDPPRPEGRPPGGWHREIGSDPRPGSRPRTPDGGPHPGPGISRGAEGRAGVAANWGVLPGV